VDFAPLKGKNITWIARVGLSILFELSHVQEFYLIDNLDHFSNQDRRPEFFKVRFVQKGLLTHAQTFREVQSILNGLTVRNVSTKSFSYSRVLYPFWRPPFRISNKEFSIIYDFSTIQFPETHSIDTINRFNQNLQLLSKFNTHCICISESTRRDALAFSDLDSTKLLVIPCGLNPFLKKSSVLSARPQKPFSRFVFIGSLEPRKRILQLIKWWQISKYRRGVASLTIIGDIAWWSNKEFLLNLKTLKKESQEFITFLGYTTEAELADVLVNSDVLVYPSKYEGFGLPVLDALFLQKVALISANSSMLEFDSNCVEYIDGDDISSWDASLDALASKLPPSHEFQAKRYNWKNYVAFLLQK
jgi:glycosyltransferase involved in cell wall biosynthesis